MVLLAFVEGEHVPPVSALEGLSDWEPPSPGGDPLLLQPKKAPDSTSNVAAANVHRPMPPSAFLLQNNDKIQHPKKRGYRYTLAHNWVVEQSHRWATPGPTAKPQDSSDTGR